MYFKSHPDSSAEINFIFMFCVVRWAAKIVQNTNGRVWEKEREPKAFQQYVQFYWHFTTLKSDWKYWFFDIFFRSTVSNSRCVAAAFSDFFSVCNSCCLHGIVRHLCHFTVKNVSQSVVFYLAIISSNFHSNLSLSIHPFVCASPFFSLCLFYSFRFLRLLLIASFSLFNAFYFQWDFTMKRTTTTKCTHTQIIFLFHLRVAVVDLFSYFSRLSSPIY